MLESLRNWSLKLRQKKRFALLIFVLLVLITLVARVGVAHFLANDEPNDGKVYSQIARNLLEQNVYSVETQTPFNPTLIRLPGYPLFLAAVYSVFGHGNNEAVRIIQAIFDTLTCILIAAITWNWTSDEKRRKRTAFWAFALAALCPFTAIYTATILTETLTIFLLAAMVLAATFAFKATVFKTKFMLWALAGLSSGLAVLLRPDSGLFAAGIGLTIVIAGFFGLEKKCENFDDGNSESKKLSRSLKIKNRVLQIIWQGFVFSFFFVLPLAPWTIRNERVFGVFQPLAPAHAEAAGEFVSRGYYLWLQTWIDDQRYIEPVIWNLDDKSINVEQIPASAFDSEDERNQVAALLEKYNHPPQSDDAKDSNQADSPTTDESNDSANDDSGDDKNDADDDKNDADDAKSDNGADDSDNSDDSGNAQQNVEMTPEIDAGFAQIGQDRIDRAPFRYYVWLPIKRAAALWFDTHSAYYPFAGELFPLKNLDRDENQQIWLPLFAALVWIYTLLAFAGAFFLWRARAESHRWLLLAVLMTIPRIAFFATIENPEPRYVVEIFVFTAVLGATALARISFKRSATRENPQKSK